MPNNAAHGEHVRRMFANAKFHIQNTDRTTGLERPQRRSDRVHRGRHGAASLCLRLRFLELGASECSTTHASHALLRLRLCVRPRVRRRACGNREGGDERWRRRTHSSGYMNNSTGSASTQGVRGTLVRTSGSTALALRHRQHWAGRSVAAKGSSL